MDWTLVLTIIAIHIALGVPSFLVEWLTVRLDPSNGKLVWQETGHWYYQMRNVAWILGGVAVPIAEGFHWGHIVFAVISVLFGGIGIPYREYKKHKAKKEATK